MFSKTDICNYALIRLGKASITNIDTDTSTQAENLRLVYNFALDLILRECEWSFAVVRKSLNRLASSPPFEWKNQFTLPTEPELIRLINVYTGWESNYSSRICDNKSFALGGNLLLSNYEYVSIKYIGRITNTNYYSPTFIEALSFLIASKAAKLTGEKDLGQIIYKDEYIPSLLNAITQNKVEIEQECNHASWSSARIGGYRDPWRE